jgi:hypothetical protein
MTAVSLFALNLVLTFSRPGTGELAKVAAHS